ncbi:hypothetical protein J3Q64DRAFT_1868443 [Phycomyces blakesleeanus]|uniref:Uncharacterized protein n=2 Tax=Phycomyces blakesleeanus TaxID=4837 RepID=A0A167JYR8_PHYB8|nr:hypothetical protein PHYBLDRAFT_151874 [Phycomyces blakesleeanus NRRL 1555(-)]OAD66937.1 hypothetical protein PHYBLDRAFT_151874 [Phycomyces blakesleeanus NRRL 1555(-)]|eukprot:XP_018284977.1 hypothetical protein PHYBLDRAFT_151874 [Phycomyces blakesleeanus NRRL 1555(-)]
MLWVIGWTCVLTRVDGTYHDLINCKFANDKLGLVKLNDDHLKILQESKVILDDLANNKFMQPKDVRWVIVPSFRTNGSESKINLMKLVAPGLYSSKYLGSVNLPYLVNDLPLLKIKAIPRLLYMKHYAIKNGRLLHDAIKKDRRRKKSSSYQRSPSNDGDIGTEVHWTRKTWFPNMKAKLQINMPFDI